jgi:hypothetical protein
VAVFGKIGWLIIKENKDIMMVFAIIQSGFVGEVE